ncbi:MAG: hypothetical protein WC480_03960 [Patescibacteria group bacterium]
MLNKKQKIKSAIFALFSLLLVAAPVVAADFNPNYLISDEELRDKDAMTDITIQKFLDGQSGTLDTYTCLAQGKDQNDNPITERQVTAAQAFYEIAQRWNISPRFLLVLVQKEQSLITDNTPKQSQYDWATGYAVCDGCSTSDPAIQRWRGFYKQVNSAAAQFDYYLQNPSGFRFKKGLTYTIDGKSVTPANDTTAAMYNYTPHLHGNQNFNEIWTNWFTKRYPDGSLLQVKGEADVWYIQYDTRRIIKSKAVLLSRFNIEQIIQVSKSDLEAYPTGWPISLANYSLVRSPHGSIYLIVDDERRLITSDAVFKKIGWNPEEVMDVADVDLNNYFEGLPITENSVYPQGALLKNKATDNIYFVKDGVRYPILAQEVIAINYPGRKVVTISPEELEDYQLGPQIKIKDGVLLKTETMSQVYVVSGGKIRWIADEKTFNDLGYRWSNIITIPDTVFVLLEQGEMLMFAD